MTRTMKISKLFPWLITFIILITVVSGCSIIGLSVGALADADNPDRADYPADKFNQIKPGKKIEIVLRSDDTLKGEFKGIDQMSELEYESFFNEFINESNEIHTVPAPGDTITILDFSGDEFTYVLTGYNGGYLSVRRMEDQRAIEFLTGKISKIYFGNVETTSGSEIDRLILERKLPVFQTLVLDSDGERVTIPLDSIARVTRIGSNKRKWIGLALGLAIDLAMFIWITNSPWNLS